MNTPRPKRRFRITFHGSDGQPQDQVEFDSTAVDLVGVRGEVIVAAHRHLSPAVGRPVEVTMAENERGTVTVGGGRLCRFTVLQIVRIDNRGSKAACEFAKGDILLYLDGQEWTATPVLGVEWDRLTDSGMVVLRTEAGAFRCDPDAELPYCGLAGW